MPRFRQLRVSETQRGSFVVSILCNNIKINGSKGMKVLGADPTTIA
jgi:hypothetical protein